MRRAAIVGVAALWLLCFAAGSSATSTSSAGGARSPWGTGVEAALPADAAVGKHQQAGVFSISCASAGNCSAIGGYDDKSGGMQSLLLTERAGRWARGVEPSLPANAVTTKQNAGLESISCGSAGNCLAVGFYRDGPSSTAVLLVSESGGRWSAGVEAALPTNAATTNQDVEIGSVSCAAAGNCSAVGSYRDSSGNIEGLLLTETGGSWAVGVEAALPANAAAIPQEVGLASVSCPTAGNCSAVGLYRDDSGRQQALLLTETAGTWSAGVEPALPANASGPSWGNSVACASAGNCSAVGEYYTASGGRPLLLTETGGHWAAGVEAVLPPNAVAGRLDSFGPISCASAGNCSAVGAYTDSTGNGDQLLLISETAGTWGKARTGTLPTDAVSGSFEPALSSISCPSAGYCTAVGVYAAPETEGLVVTEKAGRWSRGVKAALPANGALRQSILPGLDSVSCPSNKYCGAVGVYLAHPGGTHGLLLTGPARPPCVVPELEGKSLQAAERLIRSHHCSVGTIEHVRSPTTKRGRVISQTPWSGRHLAYGGRVDLEVSRGR